MLEQGVDPDRSVKPPIRKLPIGPLYESLMKFLKSETSRHKDSTLVRKRAAVLLNTISRATSRLCVGLSCAVKWNATRLTLPWEAYEPPYRRACMTLTASRPTIHDSASRRAARSAVTRPRPGDERQAIDANYDFSMCWMSVLAWREVTCSEANVTGEGSFLPMTNRSADY
jgi:hypothetical protein